MASHSRILAWKTPWAEEPGRLHTVHGVAESQTQLRDYHFSLWPKAETLTDIPGFSNQMGILLGEVL